VIAMDDPGNTTESAFPSH